MRSGSPRTGARKKSPPSKTDLPSGSRVGTHKKDMRWKDETGKIWSSRFEYQVYLALKAKGYEVRPTVPGEDSFTYASPVAGAVCGECASNKVVKRRKYTPDLFVVQKVCSVGERGTAVRADCPGYYIEVKGYLRQDRRSLLRAVRKARPDLRLRLIVQRDYKVGKGTLVSWAQKFLKIPVHVWNGDIPEEWK